MQLVRMGLLEASAIGNRYNSNGNLRLVPLLALVQCQHC